MTTGFFLEPSAATVCADALPLSRLIMEVARYELELKAAKQREALEATQRQIEEASVKAQLSHARPAAGAVQPKK